MLFFISISNHLLNLPIFCSSISLSLIIPWIFAYSVPLYLYLYFSLKSSHIMLFYNSISNHLLNIPIVCSSISLSLIISWIFVYSVPLYLYLYSLPKSSYIMFFIYFYLELSKKSSYSLFIYIFISNLLLNPVLLYLYLEYIISQIFQLCSPICLTSTIQVSYIFELQTLSYIIPNYYLCL